MLVEFADIALLVVCLEDGDLSANGHQLLAEWNWEKSTFKIKVVPYCCNQNLSKGATFTLKAEILRLELHFIKIWQIAGECLQKSASSAQTTGDCSLLVTITITRKFLTQLHLCQQPFSNHQGKHIFPWCTKYVLNRHSLIRNLAQLCAFGLSYYATPQ